jgi:hypothetical protein
MGHEDPLRVGNVSVIFRGDCANAGAPKAANAAAFLRKLLRVSMAASIQYRLVRRTAWSSGGLPAAHPVHPVAQREPRHFLS